MWVTKLLISQVKKKDFLPQNDQIWPKIGIFGQFGPGHAGFFGALLVGRLVVVARGLYLARHLFTLLYYDTVREDFSKKSPDHLFQAFYRCPKSPGSVRGYIRAS